VSRVQGTVGKIWHNQRADGSQYWVLSIDGQRYSTWDSSLVANIQEGDPVEFAFTNSGRYRNLTAIKRLPGSPFITADKLVPGAGTLRSIRMSCLRTAAEMLKDTTFLPEQRVSLSIAMAKRLENHVLGLPEAEPDDQSKGEGQASEIERGEKT
jgi:hypothetical protein